MAAVWISKDSWLTVWTALHNIHIRQSLCVTKASATLSGRGATTRLSIDLPQTDATGGACDLQVTGPALAAGTPVVMTGEVIKSDIPLTLDRCQAQCFGVAAATDSNHPWGILNYALAAKGRSTARFAGVVAAAVTISRKDHAFAVPMTGILRSANYGAEILWRQSETGTSLCLLRLTAAGGGAYQGPFAVTYDAINKTLAVAAGYLLRNGELLAINAQQGITATNGVLCLKSSLTVADGKGSWSAPACAIVTPATDAVPLAKITVTGDAVTVEQLSYGMAVMNVAQLCPLAEY